MVAHMYGLSIVTWSWVQVGWREVTVWIAVDDTVCVCVYAGRTSMHCTVIGHFIYFIVSLYLPPLHFLLI